MPAPVLIVPPVMLIAETASLWSEIERVATFQRLSVGLAVNCGLPAASCRMPSSTVMAVLPIEPPSVSPPWPALVKAPLPLRFCVASVKVLLGSATVIPPPLDVVVTGRVVEENEVPSTCSVPPSSVNTPAVEPRLLSAETASVPPLSMVPPE